MFRRDFIKTLAAALCLPLVKVQEYAAEIEAPKFMPIEDRMDGYLPWLPVDKNAGVFAMPFSKLTPEHDWRGILGQARIPDSKTAMVYDWTIFNRDAYTETRSQAPWEIELRRVTSKYPLLCFKMHPDITMRYLACPGEEMMFGQREVVQVCAHSQCHIQAEGMLLARFRSSR